MRKVPDNTVIGCTGVITVATRGAAGPGEVHVQVRGGSEDFIAWSERPLERGASVMVVESRGHRAVDVVVWPEPDPLDALLDEL